MRFDMEQVHEQHMVMRAARRIYRILRHNFEFAELWTGILSLLWGIWLLNPASDTLVTSPTFRLMNDLAPEWAWGAWITSVGALQLLGLGIDHRRIRFVSTLTAFLLWTFVSLMFILSNPLATSTVIYPLVAVAVGWSFLRIGYVRGGGSDEVDA